MQYGSTENMHILQYQGLKHYKVAGPGEIEAKNIDLVVIPYCFVLRSSCIAIC